MSAVVEPSASGQQDRAPGAAGGTPREQQSPAAEAVEVEVTREDNAASEAPEETSDVVDVDTLRERQRLHNEYRRWMLANSACSSGSASVTREVMPEVRARQTGRNSDAGGKAPSVAPRAGETPPECAGASSSSTEPHHHVNASEAWEEGRKRWRARKGGYKRHLPVTAASMRDFNFEDYILYPGREFPVPIPLPDAVDMLVDIWLQEGMYD
mmetsp:Transcript_19822/g.35392  ORF Transcript_19822/g.35392 Transcript_19822/m.35392 type:complete len:212 (-) Transcript_19822:331-966(-)